MIRWLNERFTRDFKRLISFVKDFEHCACTVYAAVRTVFKCTHATDTQGKVTLRSIILNPSQINSTQPKRRGTNVGKKLLGHSS